jgi:hypothetical protein
MLPSGLIQDYDSSSIAVFASVQERLDKEREDVDVGPELVGTYGSDGVPQLRV